MMSIGALQEATGTPVSALRFYERKGLLPEPPRVSGRRRYPDEAVDRVLTIRMWQRAGFTINEITLLLAEGERRRVWQALVRAKIADLNARQVEMERTCAQLEHALLCRAPDWTNCGWMQSAARAAGQAQQ
jgi:MerR family redox-sensitive transcriptional activator SoxR